jgi:hypothetical protein
LYRLIASFNEPPCVQSIIVDTNKVTEEQGNIKFVQIIEHELCNDHFIHGHFRELTIRLLWCECAADTISRIAYCLLLVASV